MALSTACPSTVSIGDVTVKDFGEVLELNVKRRDGGFVFVCAYAHIDHLIEGTEVVMGLGAERGHTNLWIGSEGFEFRVNRNKMSSAIIGDCSEPVMVQLLEDLRAVKKMLSALKSR